MPTKDWIPDILLLLHCILDERVGSCDGNGEGVVDPSDAIENTHHDNEELILTTNF